MLGLPASDKAPALAATGGRAVAQLMTPWFEAKLKWLYIIIKISYQACVRSRACVYFLTSNFAQVVFSTLTTWVYNLQQFPISSLKTSQVPLLTALVWQAGAEKENTGICVKQRQNSCENKLFDKLTQTAENFQKHARQHVPRLLNKIDGEALRWLTGTRPN